MKIIDYHAHLGWDQETNTYLYDDLIEDMDKYGIDIRMVSALYGYSIEEQNNAVIELIKRYPNRIIGSAVINPKERNCIEETKRIIASGYFKAIEFDSLEHCYYPEVCPNIDEIIDLVTEAGLIVNVFTGWGPRTMPAQWAYYAKKHPNMKMVLLHMGTTDFGYGAIDLVKNTKNLYDETSGMYEFPILRRAFSNIEHNRFLFGSHYPHKFTKCSIDTFDMLNLDEEFRNKLFYENAKELLNIKEQENDR